MLVYGSKIVGAAENMPVTVYLHVINFVNDSHIIDQKVSVRIKRVEIHVALRLFGEAVTFSSLPLVYLPLFPT